MSLAVLAALVGVMAAVASTVRLDIKAAVNRNELMKARMACNSAIQRYIATISADYTGGATTTSTTSSTTSQQTGATTLQDDWAQLGQNGDEKVTVSDTWFRMQVVDASSFINTANLTQAWLNNLPMSQEQIDAYLDFTTAGETPRPDGGKDQYYNALQVPYNAKLAPLDTLDELLNIRYFTAQSIWAPQTNVVSTVSFVAGASGQQPALADLLTTYSYAPNVRPGTLGQQQPRINITTATQAQVRTLGLSPRTIAVLFPNPPARRPTFANLGALIRVVTNPSDQTTEVFNDSLGSALSTITELNMNSAIPCSISSLFLYASTRLLYDNCCNLLTPAGEIF